MVTSKKATKDKNAAKEGGGVRNQTTKEGGDNKTAPPAAQDKKAPSSQAQAQALYYKLHSYAGCPGLSKSNRRVNLLPQPRSRMRHKAVLDLSEPGAVGPVPLHRLLQSLLPALVLARRKMRKTKQSGIFLGRYFFKE